MSITLCSLSLCVCSHSSCAGGYSSAIWRMVQEGFDTAPHADWIRDNLLYLASPKLRGMCVKTVRDWVKRNPSLFNSLFGRGHGGTCPLSPLWKEQWFCNASGARHCVALALKCLSFLTDLLAFLFSRKRDPSYPVWMPKSCTVLKSLTFLLCLIAGLDLHCLPSVYLSLLLLCLLHQVFQNPQQLHWGSSWCWLMHLVLCSAIQGSPLHYSEIGLSPKAQGVCSKLTAHGSCLRIRLWMVTCISC